MASCCFPRNDSCVFCNVTTANGFNIVYEDNDLIAFHDRAPGAKSHLLITPRKHIGSVEDLGRQHRDLLSDMVDIGHQLIKNENVRMGFHVPPYNSVNHLHLHVLEPPYRNFWRKVKYQPNMPWFAPVYDVMTQLSSDLRSVGVSTEY